MLEQYTGSSNIRFRYIANNYKSTHLQFKDKKQVPKEALKQKHFPGTLLLKWPQCIQDWIITFIE